MAFFSGCGRHLDVSVDHKTSKSAPSPKCYFYMSAHISLNRLGRTGRAVLSLGGNGQFLDRLFLQQPLTMLKLERHISMLGFRERAVSGMYL